jgi:hypothetical protein
MLPECIWWMNGVDSMAAGVSGSAVVLCFMSEAYQNSENCKLELKFARQQGIPIVPVRIIVHANV